VEIWHFEVLEVTFLLVPEMKSEFLATTVCAIFNGESFKSSLEKIYGAIVEQKNPQNLIFFDWQGSKGKLSEIDE
jgi:hypothetical protein